MNTLAATFNEAVVPATFATLVLILISLLFYGRYLSNINDEFMEKVRKQFPGCTVERECDACEVIIVHNGQPYLVSQDTNGSIQSDFYEPDANEALS